MRSITTKRISHVFFGSISFKDSHQVLIGGILQLKGVASQIILFVNQIGLFLLYTDMERNGSSGTGSKEK